MAELLTVYFTSDTHGYLYPTNYADTQPRPMGLLSMHFPKNDNTLIIDGGDTIQGSPLAYYCHSHSVELPVAEAMNQRGYDYVTLGNHDFNNGYHTLAKYLNSLNAQCLCANVEDVAGQLPIAAYTIHTLGNGLRIGLVGVVTDWVKLWEKPENLEKLSITDPLAAVERAVKALEGKVDLLIGIYHGGFEKDLATERVLSETNENIGCLLCERFPFDLLLTGHQHAAMANIDYHGTHVVQTPCNATAYCKVTLDADRRFHSQVCPVTDIPALSGKEEALYRQVTDWLDRPIGHLSRPLWPEDKLSMALYGSPIADFFNQVQLDASGAELSCTALGNDIRGFDSDVTVRDVVASYIYSNTLVVLEVTGAVLRQALEQCAAYFQPQGDGVRIAESFLQPKEAHYNYDYFRGIDYTFDLRQPIGSRVTRMERGGQPIADDERLSLCMCNYRATGAGDFEFYQTCPHLKEIQREISELILDYFSANACVQVEDKAAYTVILPDGTVARRAGNA